MEINSFKKEKGKTDRRLVRIIILAAEIAEYLVRQVSGKKKKVLF